MGFETFSPGDKYDVEICLKYPYGIWNLVESAFISAVADCLKYPYGIWNLDL